MQQRGWVTRFFMALVAIFAMSFLLAPSASAACIGGQDYVGVSPTGPVKIGTSAYVKGVSYTVPEWYGYGAPPITAWYNNSTTGIINPNSSLCSTTDFGGLFNQGIPEGISSITAGLLGIDFALLDVSTFSGSWITNTQETIKGFINSGPYSNLYNVLVWLVVAIGIVTVFLLVITQDQRDRSGMMRTLMSGGSVRSRKSAAIKEIGWIFLSVMTFGFIITGVPYAIQNVVTDVSSGFSTAIAAELNNFSAGISGDKNSTVTTDICAHTSVNAYSVKDGNAAIQCNLYRIYEWTPWLVMQFGGTNPANYQIDPTNHFIADGDEVKMAIEQVREKFGDEAATLAPYIQMQILRGNNNEGYSGTPELTIKQRYQAFMDFGLAVDEAKISQPWAQYWAGQGEAKVGRTFNAIITLLFVLIFVFPVVTIVLLGNALAGLGAAVIPIFGIFFALLIGVRQWRKKGMKILKWWIYCLLIPPVVSFSLALSLTMALLITGLIDFNGLSLFLYLVISSFVFVGVLLYLLFMLRGSAKKAAGSVDGSGDEPGMISKAMPAAGAIAGNMIAPGIGGAIGGAIGAGMAGGGDEPRPEMSDASGDEGRPALPAGSGRSALALGAGGGAEPRVSPYGYADDEIIDAEIVDETPPARLVGGQARAIESSDYGDMPRVLPPSAAAEGESPQGPSGGSNADGERISAMTDEGVQRIKDATYTGATIVDAVAQDRAARLFDGAEQAATAFNEAADQATQRATETIAQQGESQRSAVASEGEEGRARLFRHSGAAAQDVQQAHATASEGLSQTAADMRQSISDANAEMSATVGAADDVARELHGVAHDLADAEQGYGSHVARAEAVEEAKKKS